MTSYYIVRKCKVENILHLIVL